jgi:ribose-phosphate pyrophosphokinase
VRILNIEDCVGREVMVFHRLYPKQNSAFVELLLILEALKEHKAHVTVVAPYLPYARHEKQILDGEIASAPITCNLIAAAGCEKLITFDCHFLNEVGETKYGNLKIQNLSMGEELVAKAREFFEQEEFEIIGLDEGAAYLVAQHGGKTMKKTRKPYEGGKIAYREIEGLVCEFDVAKKNVLLLDDMISTGATMVRGTEKIKSCGAKKICVAAVHGLFLFDSAAQISKQADRVFATDTINSGFAQVSIKNKLVSL